MEVNYSTLLIVCWRVGGGGGERQESVLRYRTPYLIKFCCKAKHSISPYHPYRLQSALHPATFLSFSLLVYWRINSGQLSYWNNFNGHTRIRHGLQNAVACDLDAVTRVYYTVNQLGLSFILYFQHLGLS